MSTGKNQLFNQKIQVMNNYELMVIFTPVLSEEDFKSAQKKYQDRYYLKKILNLLRKNTKTSSKKMVETQ